MLKPLDHYWYSTNLLSLLLLPLSGLLCSLGYLRQVLYKLGWLKSFKAPVPVVIIGNISVGGTGKTPLIIELVNQLRLQGHRPGVISRGYGGQSATWPLRVNEQSTAAQVGDEPSLIYQTTGCPLVVGPDRKADIDLLLKTDDCDIILSDDGLQHYALERDLEIAVVDAQRLFGNGFCIPSGPLREPVSRLHQVDLVVFNGGSTDQVSFTMQAQQCCLLRDNSVINIESFAGQTVHAVAGIGHPQRFFSMLEKLGINVIPHAYADHYAFSLNDIVFDDPLPVLMTEKDAVKCEAFETTNTWSVPVTVNLSKIAQKNINQLFDTRIFNAIKPEV